MHWCNNQLTYLHTLPQNLEILYCCDNQLTYLPTLPQNLKELYCANNQLTSLPTLPQRNSGDAKRRNFLSVRYNSRKISRSRSFLLLSIKWACEMRKCIKNKIENKYSYINYTNTYNYTLQ